MTANVEINGPITLLTFELDSGGAGSIRIAKEDAAPGGVSVTARIWGFKGAPDDLGLDLMIKLGRAAERAAEVLAAAVKAGPVAPG